MNALENKINIIDKLNSIEQLDYEKINIIKSSTLNTIELKENKKLSIVELFEKELDDTLISREFILGENSIFTYLKLSYVDTDVSYDVKAKSEAQVSINLFDLESKNKNTINASLEEAQIDLKVNALVNLKKDASAFNSFNITHVHKNTYSDIKVRHLLDDNSKAEFEAVTVIENDALYSKGFQDSKSILLSDDASIKARPHLEILTDELEASHGATTGGLDKDSIYYLMSRGLSKDKAISILIEAFANVSIENIKDEEIQVWLSEYIKEI